MCIEVGFKHLFVNFVFFKIYFYKILKQDFHEDFFYKMKNSYKRAEAEYDTAVRQVQAEVERAVQDRNGAGAALNQAERRESVQDEAWRLNVKKFDQGLISPIDFRKASDNMLNAKTERLNALLKWHLKSSIVKYYNGISYIDQY